MALLFCLAGAQGIFGKHQLDKRVYDVPADIDQEVARLKLSAMKIAIDALTAGQQDYLSSWEEGT